MIFILILCFSTLLTTVLIPVTMKAGHLLGMLDVPGSRRVHSHAVPKTGGIAIAIGTLVPLLVIIKISPYVLGICLGALCILAVGMVDDLFDLDYRLKFIGQIAAAVVFLHVSGMRLAIFEELWPAGSFNSGVPAFLLSVFFIVATINAINLADGLDGLAAGIGLLIFTSTSFLAYTQNDFRTLSICVCMIGASIGFLRFNTYPAVVFMGDTGSQLLGYMVSVSMMLFTQPRLGNSSVLALYFIGIPVLDTAMVMLERLIEHRPVFKPDMNHIHHKLLKLGYRHSYAVVIIYSTQLGMILMGWTMRRFSGLFLLLVYICLMAAFLALLLLARTGHLSGSHGVKAAGCKEENIRSNPRRSRLLVSKASWACLTGALLVFYFYSPFLGIPVAKDMGLYSLGFALVILLLRVIRKEVPGILLRLSAYFPAVYYIILFDFANNHSGVWHYEELDYYFVIYILLGISYICYLLTTYDEIPVVAMDYLLLAVVILTFFLPVSLLTQYHINTITIKTLIIFLGFELLHYKLGDRCDPLIACLISALCLNFFMAFWPWVV